MDLTNRTKITETKDLDPVQENRLFELWNNEYPEKLKHDSIAELRDYFSRLEQLNHFLLTHDNKIMGWAFTFIRNSENWFAVIVDSQLNGQGYGTKLLQKIKENAVALNGWVIDHGRDRKQNGEVYRSPLNFYLKNNFLTLPDRLELEKISAVKIRWQKT